MRWPGVNTQRAFPFAREGDHGLVAKLNAKRIRFCEEPALWFHLEHTHGQNIPTGLQDAVIYPIRSWILHPGTGTDPMAIDVGGVHLFYRTEEYRRLRSEEHTSELQSRQY